MFVHVRKNYRLSVHLKCKTDVICHALTERFVLKKEKNCTAAWCILSYHSVLVFFTNLYIIYYFRR